MSEALIEIKDLVKTFSLGQPPALDHIDVNIPKGKIIGLVGPDGSGKTTLLRLIAGLLTPSKGHIAVAGYDTIQDAEYIHYLTGYMPQKFGLYEDLTVEQNLNLYADLRNVLGKEKEATYERLLHFTNLKNFTGYLARNLSGGMKQKLGLACALIKKPKLLLLDEPSVGIDPISRRELWKMVRSLIDEGISVLWSTAYLDEAERCDRVLLLREGKLLYQGDPQELTKKIAPRVFALKNVEKDPRTLLFKLLNDERVIDGAIQGKNLRLVLRDEKEKPKGLQLEKVAPRFEDAFIDILGGGPGGESKLADAFPSIQTEKASIIDAEKLTKKFGSFVAAGEISLSVKKGEIFGLLGPNGAGKTTTFRMLCGLLTPTSGKAFVKGLDLETAQSQARSKIGYMAQKFSLYGNLNVKQNLEFFAGIYNLKNREKKEIIEEMIAIFNLEPYLFISADTLPLGYKQRLSLACASMHRPEVLFLDEPTSGVDPITRREFWNHINGLVRKGVTIMITTHFMDEAEYCDRIALVYSGRIIQIDTPDALKTKICSKEMPNPTLEDAFIHLIENYRQI